MQDPLANGELLRAYGDAMHVVAHGPRSVRDRNIGASLTGTIDDARDEIRSLLQLLSRLTRALHPTLSLVVGPDAIYQSGTPIGDDEPVFILRAKDRHAPDTVRHWAGLCYARGRGDAIASRDARRHADAMEEWGKAHGTQSPDVPGSANTHTPYFPGAKFVTPGPIATSRYQNGRIVLLVGVPNAPSMSKLTVNLPDDVPLADDEFAIKDYSENTGVLESLVNSGLVHPPHKFVADDHVSFPIVRIKSDALARLIAETPTIAELEAANDGSDGSDAPELGGGAQ
jgi:hypothetical protein